MGRPRKPLKQAYPQPVATHGNRFGAHGKEGVNGSSPLEGLWERPAPVVLSTPHGSQGRVSLMTQATIRQRLAHSDHPPRNRASVSRLQPRPPKDSGLQQAFAPYFADLLPNSHREALRAASVLYLEECYDALRSVSPESGFAKTAIAEHLPQRYESYYNGLFAKEWTTTVAVAGWKLAQRGQPTLACLAEELALNHRTASSPSGSTRTAALRSSPGQRTTTSRG